MAMRRSRGQVRIELAFAGAAMIVAFVGFYTVFVQSKTAESADEARSALGLPPVDDRGLIIGDGDGFVVTEDGAATSADPGSDGIDGADAGSVDGPVTTGPDGRPIATPGTGVLPSGDTPGAGTSGVPGTGTGGGSGSGGGGEGAGGTGTSLPPTSPTDPGTSTSTSTPPTSPTDPGPTTTTTAPASNGGVVQAIIDLLGL
jgi:hypothetical protein